MSTARALSALFTIALVPACATEAPEAPAPYGVEPRLPCAAVGYHEDAPDRRDSYRYEYDDRGNETVRVVENPSGFVEARFAAYEADQLVSEEIRMNDLHADRRITLDRGRPVDEVLTVYLGGSESQTRTFKTWRFDESPPALADERKLDAFWGESVTAYRALTDEVGFTGHTCAVGAADECADVDFLGPYEYVGDERGWTTMRVRSPGFDPMIVAERSFDEHGLLVSKSDYRLTEGENGIVRELAERITWTRDADGALLGWHRTRPDEPGYRYQAQYSACPTR